MSEIAEKYKEKERWDGYPVFEIEDDYLDEFNFTVMEGGQIEFNSEHDGYGQWDHCFATISREVARALGEWLLKNTTEEAISAQIEHTRLTKIEYNKRRAIEEKEKMRIARQIHEKKERDELARLKAKYEK